MAIGVTLPFRISSGSVGYFETSNTEIEAVENNVRSLLVTNWGERPMRYRFGCNLREFLFEPLRNEELKIRIADRISDQIKQWLPFLRLKTLNIFFFEDGVGVSQNSMRISLELAFVNRPDILTAISQDIN